MFKWIKGLFAKVVGFYKNPHGDMTEEEKAEHQTFSM